MKEIDHDETTAGRVRRLRTDDAGFAACPFHWFAALYAAAALQGCKDPEAQGHAGPQVEQTQAEVRLAGVAQEVPQETVK